MLNMLLIHPFMTFYIAASFCFTFAVYLFPYYTKSHFLLSGELNAGTFLGTMVHKNFGHLLMNLLFLVPAWIYADSKLGIGLVFVLVLMDMLATGLIVLVADGYMCGSSGVAHFLIGLVSIIGNWGVFGIGLIIIVPEIKHLGDDTEVSHKGHLINQVAGIITGIILGFFRG